MDRRRPRLAGLSSPPALTLSLVLFGLTASFFAATPALAKGPSKKLKKIAKTVGVSPERLIDIKFERYFARDPYERRALIKDIALKPRADLLPLAVFIGTKETKDESMRRCSIRLYSHFGLKADREDIRKHVLPAVELTLKKARKRGQDVRWTFDELVRLSRWFELDAELADRLIPVFEGRDFNLRSLAFKALRSVRHTAIEKDFLKPACLRVYGAKKGYSLFDRFGAVSELQEREIGLIGPPLRDAMLKGKDPKMQVNAFYVFRDWKDPSTLKLARAIDVKAVHKLRRAALRVRVSLDDPSLVPEVSTWFAKDHIDMIATALEDIGELKTRDKALMLLEKCWNREVYPAVRARMWQRRNQGSEIDKEKDRMKLAAAVGLLRADKDTPVTWLRSIIAGGEFSIKERKALCYKIMRMETEAVNGLIVDMIDIKAPEFADIRKQAVIAAGERRIKDAKKILGELYWDKKDWGHLKFHAGISLYEIEAPKALKNLVWFLPKYEDAVVKEDRWQFVMGKTQFKIKRWSGSGFIEALDKFERTKSERCLALIDEFLKPVPTSGGKSGDKDKKGDKGKKDKGKGDKGKGDKDKTRTEPGTVERGTVPENAEWKPTGPEPVYQARNQFVRARAVEVAAKIGGRKAGKILNRAIDDYRSIVRVTAVRAIGELSKRFSLPVGSRPEEEAKARAQAVGWLIDEGLRDKP